ncbi:MAG: ACT domain-containing protein [Firmicutes bacterium]|nr:ACT domain-containing protein [Bacillota bacterium]
MKAVITVIGKDTVGILAKVSGVCANVQANVAEVTQSIMQEYFAMIMMVEIDKMTCSIEDLKNELAEVLPEMQIHVMHEDIFNSMHRI